ncbi:MAG TPA: PRC-barrel domain-containing protein [Acetobacteraceae bacterium]|nr:PRC-barrel domain-containing protein [Acetobacteraceae bacterium]
MNKLPSMIAAGALALAFAAPVPGFAQAAYSPGIVMATDHSMSAKSLIGVPVYNDQHEKIGSIETVMVKPDATEPIVVLSVGDYIGGGPKMVGVPLSHLQLQGMTAMTMAGATKPMLESLPGYAVTGG